MTETWCALLNALILSIVAGANGVLIARVNRVQHTIEDPNNGYSRER
jgi:hypothetical protein